MSNKNEQTPEVKRGRGRPKGTGGNKRPDISARNEMNISPGDMGKFLGNALEIASLPPVDTSDPKNVQERIGKYFEIVARHDMKPSVAGMAMALGIDRRTLWEWVTTGRKGKEVTDILKKGYQILNHLMEDYMQNGQINPVAGIFLMKNNFNYKDQQEMVLTPNNPLGDQKNTEELRQKYLDSVVVDELPEAENEE